MNFSALPFIRQSGISRRRAQTLDGGPAPSPAPRWLRVITPALCLVLVGWLGAGCASSSKNAPLAATQPPPTQPPVFLNGAMALLLTNVNGFRAHVVLEEGSGGSRVTTGELIGRGGNLLFLPFVEKSVRKRSLAADSAFIWDVPAHRGYIVNGAMQAYAPITSSRYFTNITVSPAVTAAAERVSGHRCQRAEAVITASDGSLTGFRLWQASDLEELPLRIVCTSSGIPVTLTLTKARLDTPPDDLFLPPTGFTKHSSAEALVGELIARQQNLKRRPSALPDANAPLMEFENRPPAGP